MGVQFTWLYIPTMLSGDGIHLGVHPSNVIIDVYVVLQEQDNIANTTGNVQKAGNRKAIPDHHQRLSGTTSGYVHVGKRQSFTALS